MGGKKFGIVIGKSNRFVMLKICFCELYDHSTCGSISISFSCEFELREEIIFSYLSSSLIESTMFS